MKNKLIEHLIETAIKSTITNLIKEDVDINFLSDYNNKFKEIQDSYNKFWMEEPLSPESFKQIADSFDKLEAEYFDSQKKAKGELDKYSDEQFYDKNNTTLMDMDKSIDDFSSKVNQFANAITQSEEIVKKLTGHTFNVELFK